MKEQKLAENYASSVGERQARGYDLSLVVCRTSILDLRPSETQKIFVISSKMPYGVFVMLRGPEGN